MENEELLLIDRQTGYPPGDLCPICISLERIGLEVGFCLNNERRCEDCWIDALVENNGRSRAVRTTGPGKSEKSYIRASEEED